MAASCMSHRITYSRIANNRISIEHYSLSKIHRDQQMVISSNYCQHEPFGRDKVGLRSTEALLIRFAKGLSFLIVHYDFI